MFPVWKLTCKVTCQCTAQSANFGKFWLNYLNLAPFLLLDPVLLRYVRFDPPLCLSLPYFTSTSTFTFCDKIGLQQFHVVQLNSSQWKTREKGNSTPEFLALKHKSRILGHSSNPVCGFSTMEQVRLCAVWPMENWLGSSLNQIQGWTTVRESYSCALEQGPLQHTLPFPHPAAYFLS